LNQKETVLPIDPEIVRKSGMIRNKLAELSYVDPDKAIELLRIWGEHRMPITPFYDTLINAFPKEKQAVGG